jgi:large subunit ribosomal protein L17
MRHHNSNRKFGRKTDQRRALMRSLAIALLKHKKIETTEAKAKELRKYVEKLITKGKKEDLATRRLLISKLGSGGIYVIDNIFKLGKEFQDRPGGYTRIIKKGERIGSDGASMAIIEFIK